MKYAVFAAGVLALALSPASAATVDVQFGGLDNAAIKLSAKDLNLGAGPVVSNFATSALSYSYVGGASFLAFCIEPEQSNGRAGVSLTYTVDSFTGTQSKLLQGLYSTEYAKLASYTDKAAFQVAVWEIVRETSGTLNAADGKFFLMGTSNQLNSQSEQDAVANLANSFLAAAAGYTGAAQYGLVKLTNATRQDLITATPLAAVTPNVTPVPEPETYALLLAGLGVVGLKARRRSAR
ncbi:PEP-CTERM sorting domain-containing protein [Roseateles sp. BYS87W]|uniref:PEP-CTERM sorting domain-containing protein n=1 Tax=Pelomonas baiyunensis TaxID=3299026 RepID=A0ABW7H314_9BURK